jgi:5-methylcytosine-specific restriction endonuclease McrA
MGADQGGMCPLCGQELDGEQEVDHKVPVTYGGGNERNNLPTGAHALQS